MTSIPFQLFPRRYAHVFSTVESAPDALVPGAPPIHNQVFRPDILQITRADASCCADTRTMSPTRHGLLLAALWLPVRDVDVSPHGFIRRFWVVCFCCLELRRMATSTRPPIGAHTPPPVTETRGRSHVNMG